MRFAGFTISAAQRQQWPASLCSKCLLATSGAILTLLPFAVQCVRKTLFNRVRQRIEERLFLAKPTFCSHLIDIHSHAADIAAVKMAYCNPNHLYQLEEYADLQLATREQKAKPALEAIAEKIQQVGGLCKVAGCAGRIARHAGWPAAWCCC